MSNQSLKQAAVRAVTSTSGTYEEDWLALFDDDGIAAGTFNERFLLWLEGKSGVTGLTLNEQMTLFAISESVLNWDSLGTFDASGAGLPAPTLDLLATSDRGASTSDDITNDPTPSLSIDFADSYVAGNHIHFEQDTVEVVDHTLTAGEISSGIIYLGLSALTDGTYAFRVRMSDDGSSNFSDYSNTISLVLDQSLGATTLALAAGGHTTSDTTPTLRVTNASAVANDVAVIRRDDDATVLASGTWDAADVTAGYKDLTTSELAVSTHDLVGYVYGTASGSGSGVFSVAAEETLTVSSAFHPTDISGLVFLLDAAETSGIFTSNAGSGAISDGASVGYWSDESGNSFDFSSVSDDTTRPTYRANSGFPYVEFDGSNDILRRAAATGIYAAGAGTVMFALKANPSGVHTLFVECSNSASPPFYRLAGSGTTNSSADAFIRNSGSTVLLNGGLLLTPNAFDNTDNVFAVTDSGSLLTSYLDGSSVDSQSYTRSGTMSVDLTVLGGHMASGTPANWIVVDVYAMAVFSKVLDSGELANMTTWLGAKMNRVL